MTFDEFYDEHDLHVISACIRELPAELVEPISTVILERAYVMLPTSKPAMYCVAWSMASLIDQHRTPERRAELDREWAAYEAA